VDVRSDSRENPTPPHLSLFPFWPGGSSFFPGADSLVLGVLEGSEWIFGEFLRFLGEFQRGLVIFSEF
jgi:hypothetical protein